MKEINSIIEQLEYESIQRLKWFLDGYFINGLGGGLFTKISTERICELYNVDKSYFIKP